MVVHEHRNVLVLKTGFHDLSYQMLLNDHKKTPIAAPLLSSEHDILSYKSMRA